MNRMQGLKHISEKSRFSQAELNSALSSSNITALDLLTAIYRHAALPLGMRIDAAKAAIAFTNKKMPIAIETNRPQLPLGEENLRSLSREDLLTLNGLLERMGVDLVGAVKTGA